jgi:hypothetical protein
MDKAVTTLIEQMTTAQKEWLSVGRHYGELMIDLNKQFSQQYLDQMKHSLSGNDPSEIKPLDTHSVKKSLDSYLDSLKSRQSNLLKLWKENTALTTQQPLLLSGFVKKQLDMIQNQISKK